MLEIFVGLCIILSVAVFVLAVRLYWNRRAADQLCADFAKRLEEDTNVGLDISVPDRQMRALAAELDRELKHLRKLRLGYLQGDRELKNAMTNVSHDLRTPLTAVCGYLQLLEREPLTERARGYLTIIGQRVEVMKKLTEELFSCSVILSMDLTRDQELLSLNAVLEEVMAAYYTAFTESGIVPQISLPENPVMRQVNRQALTRIVQNIVENAVKYSDGDFSVRLFENGRIEFRNHAEKLDEIAVGHLFDRFFTVEDGRNATGLGLSIAKTLTEAMGGTIEASVSEGELLIGLLLKEDE